MIDFTPKKNQMEELKSAAFLIVLALAGLVALIIGICFLLARWT
jgi:hypothetical protein